MDDDQDLRVALGLAVDDVAPTDRLVRIRQETHRRGRRRRTWWVSSGAVLALASVVTVALVSGTSSPPRAEEPAGTPSPAPAQESFSVFHVGPGPDGPDAPAATLYRSRVVSSSLGAALTAPPADPDYRTLWPVGSLGDVVSDADFVIVGLTDESLAERPAGMSVEEARLALQQVVYSVQESLGTDAGVLFELPGGTDAEVVYGIPTDLVERAPDLVVLSHLSIDEPTEGAVIPRSAGSFTASGWGNSFEASGSCSLLDGAAVPVAGPLVAQMSGWMEPRLFPWELTVDLSAVAPGSYTLACRTDDPTGGAEGRGADTDTRTVIVE